MDKQGPIPGLLPCRRTPAASRSRRFDLFASPDSSTVSESGDGSDGGDIKILVTLHGETTATTATTTTTTPLEDEKLLPAISDGEDDGMQRPPPGSKALSVCSGDSPPLSLSLLPSSPIERRMRTDGGGSTVVTLTKRRRKKTSPPTVWSVPGSAFASGLLRAFVSCFALIVMGTALFPVVILTALIRLGRDRVYRTWWLGRPTTGWIEDVVVVAVVGEGDGDGDEGCVVRGGEGDGDGDGDGDTEAEDEWKGCGYGGGDDDDDGDGAVPTSIPNSKAIRLHHGREWS